MANGDSAAEVFGREVVDRYGSAAGEDARYHIGRGDFGAAGYSAAHAVRLGRRDWTDVEQTHIADHLRAEVEKLLGVSHDAEAAPLAACHAMLTGLAPWSDSELERLRQALSDLPSGLEPYSSVAEADKLADYLLLGGAPFWSVEEFQDLRRATIVDFEHCVERNDGVLAADRLAIFDVIEEAIEGAHAR